MKFSEWKKISWKYKFRLIVITVLLILLVMISFYFLILKNISDGQRRVKLGIAWLSSIVLLSYILGKVTEKLISRWIENEWVRGLVDAVLFSLITIPFIYFLTLLFLGK